MPFEAARIDGANSRQIFGKITLPLIKPILAYTLITSLIGGIQMFDVPQILTNGNGNPDRTSMTVIMYLNKHLYSKNYGMAGALSVILFIVTAVLSIVVFNYITKDMEAAGIRKAKKKKQRRRSNMNNSGKASASADIKGTNAGVKDRIILTTERVLCYIVLILITFLCLSRSMYLLLIQQDHTLISRRDSHFFRESHLW